MSDPQLDPFSVTEEQFDALASPDELAAYAKCLPEDQALLRGLFAVIRRLSDNNEEKAVNVQEMRARLIKMTGFDAGAFSQNITMINQRLQSLVADLDLKVAARRLPTVSTKKITTKGDLLKARAAKKLLCGARQQNTTSLYPDDFVLRMSLSEYNEKFPVVHTLGYGVQGEVSLCKDTGNGGRQVAIKSYFRPVDKSLILDAILGWYLTYQSTRLAVPRVLHVVHIEMPDPSESDARLVMEYVAGSTVKNFTGPLSVRHFWNLAYQLARTVADMHALGVVHTDLYSTNVMISRNETGEVPTCYILDLGAGCVEDGPHEDTIHRASLELLSKLPQAWQDAELDFKCERGSTDVNGLLTTICQLSNHVNLWESPSVNTGLRMPEILVPFWAQFANRDKYASDRITPIVSYLHDMVFDTKFVGSGRRVKRLPADFVMHLTTEEYEKRFPLVRKLGDGAYGIISQHHDIQNDCDVAIKYFKIQEVAFIHEAVLGWYLTIHHHHKRLAIPTLYHVIVVDNEEPYLLMEFVPGDTLWNHKFEGLTVPNYWRMVSQIADTVASVHSLGIVNCDIHGDNIIMEHYVPGEPPLCRVLDFGEGCAEKESVSVFLNDACDELKVLLPAPFSEMEVDIKCPLGKSDGVRLATFITGMAIKIEKHLVHAEVVDGVPRYDILKEFQAKFTRQRLLADLTVEDIALYLRQKVAAIGTGSLLVGGGNKREAEESPEKPQLSKKMRDLLNDAGILNGFLVHMTQAEWNEQYTMTSHVGAGESGTVDKMRDAVNQRDVAVKTSTTDAKIISVLKEALIGWYLTVAEKTPTLGVPTVYSLVIVDDAVGASRYRLVMEYLESVHVGEFLKDAAEYITLPEFWSMAIEIMETVQTLHSKGIVHRDAHALNIVITKGARRRARLIDFGAACLCKKDQLGQLAKAAGIVNYHAGTDITLDKLACTKEGKAVTKPEVQDIQNMMVTINILSMTVGAAPEGRAATPKLVTGMPVAILPFLKLYMKSPEKLFSISPVALPPVSHLIDYARANLLGDFVVVMSEDVFRARFSYVESLGSGSYGVVDLVVDELKDINVAIKTVKVLPPGDMRGKLTEMELIREAYVGWYLTNFARGSLVSVPSVYHLIVLEGVEGPQRLKLVMEYVEGKDLVKIRTSDSIDGVDDITFDDFFNVACDLLEALERIHEAGIVQHDVDCRNIILTPHTAEKRRKAYLVDFGLMCLQAGPASEMLGEILPVMCKMAGADVHRDEMVCEAKPYTEDGHTSLQAYSDYTRLLTVLVTLSWVIGEVHPPAGKSGRDGIQVVYNGVPKALVPFFTLFMEDARMGNEYAIDGKKAPSMKELRRRAREMQAQFAKEDADRASPQMFCGAKGGIRMRFLHRDDTSQPAEELFIVLAKFMELSHMLNGQGTHVYNWMQVTVVVIHLRRWFTRGFDLIAEALVIPAQNNPGERYLDLLESVLRTYLAEDSTTVIPKLSLMGLTASDLETVTAWCQQHGPDETFVPVMRFIHSNSVVCHTVIQFAEKLYYEERQLPPDTSTGPVATIRRVMRDRFPIQLLERQIRGTRVVYTQNEHMFIMPDTKGLAYWFYTLVLRSSKIGDGFLSNTSLAVAARMTSWDRLIVALYDSINPELEALATSPVAELSVENVMVVARFWLLHRWAIRYEGQIAMEKFMGRDPVLFSEYYPKNHDGVITGQLAKASDITLRDYIRLSGMGLALDASIDDVRSALTDYRRWLMSTSNYLTTTPRRMIYAISCLVGFELVRQQQYSLMMAIGTLVKARKVTVKTGPNKRLARFIRILGKVSKEVGSSIAALYTGEDLARPAPWSHFELFASHELKDFIEAKESHWTTQALDPIQ